MTEVHMAGPVLAATGREGVNVGRAQFFEGSS